MQLLKKHQNGIRFLAILVVVAMIGLPFGNTLQAAQAGRAGVGLVARGFTLDQQREIVRELKRGILEVVDQESVLITPRKEQNMLKRGGQRGNCNYAEKCARLVRSGFGVQDIYMLRATRLGSRVMLDLRWFPVSGKPGQVLRFYPVAEYLDGESIQGLLRALIPSEQQISQVLDTQLPAQMTETLAQRPVVAQEQREEKGSKWYKTWWFWTIVGAAAAGGAAVAVTQSGGGGGSADQTINGSIQLR